MSVAEAILRVRDQASGPLHDIASAASDAEDSLDRAGDAAGDASSRFASAGDTFGNVGGAAGKLAGGLDMLVPGLGSVAQGIADLADVGEVAAGGLSSISGGLGVVASAAAVAGVALAALAAAYAVVGNAMSDQTALTLEAAAAYVEADRSAAQLAGTVEALAAAQAATSAAFAGAQQQIDLLTGALTSYEVAAARAGASVRDAARGEIDVLRERLRIQLEGLAAARTVISADASTAEQKAQAIRQEAELSRAAGQTRLALTQLKEATEAQAGAVEGAVAADGLATEQKRKAADASRAAAEAERARSAALREQQAAAQAAADAEAKRREQLLATIEAEGEQIYGARQNPQIQFLTEFYQLLSQASDQQDFQLLIADLAVGMTRFGLTAEQAAAAQDALNAAMGAAPAATPGASTAMAGISAAGSVAGLTALDPTGISAAVVAGLQTVADLGAGGGLLGEVETLLTDAAKGLPALGDALVSFTGNLFETILPQLIEGAAGALTGVVNALPDILTGAFNAIPALIEAAVGSLDDLLVGTFRMAFTLVPELLIASLEALLDPQFWIDVATAFLEGLLDALNVFKNEDNTGLLQRGGIVGRTGAAVRDLFDGRDNGRIGQSNIFNFNGVIMDNLEAAARRFRDLDRRGVRR
jgi:hypothetical protein